MGSLGADSVSQRSSDGGGRARRSLGDGAGRMGALNRDLERAFRGTRRRHPRSRALRLSPGARSGRAANATDREPPGGVPGSLPGLREPSLLERGAALHHATGNVPRRTELMGGSLASRRRGARTGRCREPFTHSRPLDGRGVSRDRLPRGAYRTTGSSAGDDLDRLRYRLSGGAGGDCVRARCGSSSALDRFRPLRRVGDAQLRHPHAPFPHRHGGESERLPQRSGVRECFLDPGRDRSGHHLVVSRRELLDRGLPGRVRLRPRASDACARLVPVSLHAN